MNDMDKSQNIILSERRQTQKNIYCIIQSIKIPENLNYNGRNKISGHLRQRFGRIDHKEAKRSSLFLHCCGRF